jgi:signal transduction histidine kinase
METDQISKFKVLIHAPFGKDAILIAEVLKNSNVSAQSIKEAAELTRCIHEGCDTAIITEEALNLELTTALAHVVASQPPWSDFPLIILTGGGASTPLTDMAVRSRSSLGNISLLERPVRPATLISMVDTAFRARARQYEIRDHLEELKQAHHALQEANDRLESLVEQRTSVLRKLSSQLMRAQDDERRRMARELHDGLGQSLAAAQINLGMISIAGPNDQFLNEAKTLLSQSVSDIRTLSYLLHPPLLEEAGFYSAAGWYIDGFSKRSKVKVNVELPPKRLRMPDIVELTLFRVLQEGLINAHRHSGSDRVDVKVESGDSNISMQLRDYGKGLSKNLMEHFQKTGSASGVGIAGMRERVKELGGKFSIQSGGSGTTLSVVIPLGDEASKDHDKQRPDGKTLEPA